MKASEMIAMLSKMTQDAEVFFVEGYITKYSVKGIADIEEMDSKTIFLRAK